MPPPIDIDPSCAFSIKKIHVVSGQGFLEGRLELSVRADVHQGDQAPVLKDIWQGTLAVGQSNGGGLIEGVALSSQNDTITRDVTVEVTERDQREALLAPSEAQTKKVTFHLPDGDILSEKVLSFKLLESKTGKTALVRVTIVAGKIGVFD